VNQTASAVENRDACLEDGAGLNSQHVVFMVPKPKYRLEMCPRSESPWQPVHCCISTAPV